MNGQTIRGGPQEPVAIKTLLGWVLSGPLKWVSLTIILMLALILCLHQSNQKAAIGYNGKQTMGFRKLRN